MSFFHAKSGNIGLLTAVSLPVVLAAAIGAVEFSSLTQKKIAAQNILDELVVSCAVDYEATIGEGGQFRECTSSTTLQNRFADIQRMNFVGVEMDVVGDEEVIGKAEVEIESFVGQIIGIKAFKLTVEGAAQITRPAKVEIALVLDISASMSGNKLVQMREGALKFVERVFEDTPEETEIVFSVIPFGGNIRFPQEYSAWLPSEYESFDEDDVNPFHQHWYDNNELCFDGEKTELRQFRCAKPDTWNGCFEPESDAVIREAVVNTNNLRDPALEYNRRARGPSSPRSFVCPREPVEVLFFTESRDEIEALIANMTEDQLSWGTASDIALSWGRRVLEPKNRGLFLENSQYPAEFTSETRKHLVYLTDGRPSQFYQRNEGTAENAAKNAVGICEGIAEDNSGDATIDVWTIAYDVMNFEGALSACATPGGGFFSADNGNDVEDAFSEIAARISSVNTYLTR